MRSGKLNPGGDFWAAGEQLRCQIIQSSEVLRRSAECDPTEGSDAATEQRPQVGFGEAIDSEGGVYAALQRLRSKVIAVFEHHSATGFHGEHGPYLCRHRLPCATCHELRLGRAPLHPFIYGHTLWYVTKQCVMRGCLVGNHVRSEGT